MGFYKILASSYRLTNIFSSKNVRKIIIFLCIGLALFLFFSNNVLAYDNEPIRIEDLGVDENGTIINNSNTHVDYIKAEKNYLYRLHFNQNSRKLYVVDNLNVGSNGLLVFTSGGVDGRDYSFVGTGDFYFAASSDTYSNAIFSYEKVPINSSGVVADMVDTFSVSNLWDQLGFVVPLIGVGVLFAIGFYIVRRNTKSTSKAKVKF